MEKIAFSFGDEGVSQETVEFYVIEQTRLGGFDYILVSEEETGDGDAYILKDISKQTDTEAVYEMVEDDIELEAVLNVFENIIDDIELV